MLRERDPGPGIDGNRGLRVGARFRVVRRIGLGRDGVTDLEEVGVVDEAAVVLQDVHLDGRHGKETNVGTTSHHCYCC